MLRGLRASAQPVLRARGAKQIPRAHWEGEGLAVAKGQEESFRSRACFLGQSAVLQETGNFPISTKPFLGKVSTHHVAAVPSGSPSACLHQQRL